MTLIVGLVYADGVVLASDSQVTLETSGQPSKDATEKLYVFGGGLGWGGSGSGWLIKRVQDKLRNEGGVAKVFANDGIDAGRKKLFKIVNDLQQEAGKAFVPNTGKPEMVSGLFAGLAKGVPFIMEIGGSGGHGILEKPYGAIGSGDLFAYHAIVSMAHFNVTKLNCEQAKALAYRTVQNAITVAAYGLGGAVQLCVVDKGGAKCLDTTELKAVQDLVDLWKAQEQSTLGLLGQPAPTPTASDIPTEE